MRSQVPLILLLAAVTPLRAASAANDPHAFWRDSQGLWRAAADYYGADGTHQLRDYAQLSRVTITAGRLYLDDSAFYPPGGTYNAAYSLGLAGVDEGVELRNTQSGEIESDGSVLLDRSDLPIGASVRTRIVPIDARRALQTGDKNDGTRAYEAYWSLTAPGRRLRLLAGIDPVAKDGGPPGPGALRALASYRDTAIIDADEQRVRAELRRKQSIGVLRHAVALDGARYDIAERLDAQVTDCDRRATDPNDPQRVVVYAGERPPLTGDALAAALTACRTALRAQPDVARLQRIIARLEALQQR